jgi:hypothetical protein
MSAAGKAFETKLNILLGRLLSSELGIRATRSIPSLALGFAGEKISEIAESASITGGGIPRELPEFDLIIMNPPFTRATGRGGRKGGGLFGFILDEEVRTYIT